MTEATLLPGISTREDLSAPVYTPSTETGSESPAAPAEQDDMFGYLVGENHIGTSIHRALHKDRSIDPSFELTSDRIQKDLDALGMTIPSEWYSEFAYVGNESAYHQLLTRMEERNAINKMVEDAGGAKGMGMLLASYATDPVAFLIDAVTGFSVKGRALKRLISAGSRSGAAELAIQAALAADGETVDPLEVAAGFGAAFMVGGGIGAAFGKLDDASQMAVDSLRTIQRAAREAETGTPSSFGRDTAGAARSQDVPDSVLTRERTDDLNELRTDHAVTDAELPAYAGEGKGFGARIDAFANMWRRARKNQAQRRLIVDLVHDAIKKDPNAVNEFSAMEMADRVFGGIEGLRVRTTNKAFNRHLQNQFQMGGAKRAATAIFRGGKYADLQEKFNHQVKQYIDSEGTLEAPAEIVEAAQAHLKSFQQYKQRLIDTGVASAEELSDNPWWTPRMFNRIKMRQFVNEANSRKPLEDFFEQALASGRRKAGLEVDDDLNRLVAKRYVARLVDTRDDGSFSGIDVRFLENADRDFILDLFEETRRGRPEDDSDLQELLTILDKGMVDEDAAARTAAKEATPDHLLRRLELDLEHTMDLNGTTYRLGDLFETDMEKIAWTYGRWAAGETALKAKGYSSKGMQKLIKSAEDEAAKHEGLPDAAAYDKHQVKDLKFAYNRVMGRSLDAEMDETLVRSLRLATGLGYVTKMGSGFLNALVEAGTTLSMASVGQVIRRLPALKQIMKEVQGKDPDGPLTRQLAMLAGGIGQTLGRGLHGVRYEASEFVARGARQNGGFIDRNLAQAEDVMEGLKRGATWSNLLALVTDVTRQFSTVVGLEQLDDILVRGKKAPNWFASRAASWSMDEGRMRAIQRYLQSEAVTRGRRGEITDLGNMPPEIEDALGNYLFRYTAEAIQDIQAGNLPQMMQNPVGRLLFQFRSFTTAAWARHTLKDIHHGDSVGALKLLITGSMASAMYVGRQLAFHGTADNLDERLEVDEVVKGGVQYAVNSSLVPAIMDSVANVAFGEPVFGLKRSSELSNAFTAQSIPSMVYLGDLMTTLGVPGDLARGGSFSKEHAQALANVLLIDTLWATRPFVNMLSESRPSAAQNPTLNVWEAIGLEDGD